MSFGLIRPNFLVVLAAYQGIDFIKIQIESILSQRCVDVHVFISVDSSTDGTEDFLISWAHSEPRLSILSVGRYFGGAGRNFFRLLHDVDINECKYFCFADQDDVWYTKKLWHAHCLLNKNRAAGYSSNVMAFWPDGSRRLVNKALPQRRWDFLFEAAGPGCTYVMRKDLALSLQDLVRTRWDEVQSIGLHDWLSYAFARANGYKWVIDDRVGMDYRQHASNQVGVNSGWRAFKYRVLKVLSGWGTQQAGIIATVLDLDDTPFVRRWKSGGRLGLLWLALNANQCRRKKLDRVFFALSCVALAILGRTHKP